MSALTARLITDPDEKEKMTLTKECDARTAMARGIQDYFETFKMVIGDRTITFKQVFSIWADPEDDAEYPSAAVAMGEEASYDAARTTPTVSRNNAVPGVPNKFLVPVCELIQSFSVLIRCTDPQERSEILAMCEEGILAPADFMYGFRLVLPYYHNTRAEYEPMGVQYVDSEELAKRRFRGAILKIEARIAVLKLKEFPKADIRSRVDMEDFAEYRTGGQPPIAKLPTD